MPQTEVGHGRQEESQGGLLGPMKQGVAWEPEFRFNVMV